jgi:nicotinamidase-related amidase
MRESGIQEVRVAPDEFLEVDLETFSARSAPTPDPADVTIVCGLVEALPKSHVPSSVAVCGVCGREVWVEIDSAAERMVAAGAKVMCLPDAVAQPDFDRSKVFSSRQALAKALAFRDREVES